MRLDTGEPRSATVIAHTNCIMINVSMSGLLPFLVAKPELKEELTDLMQQRLSGKCTNPKPGIVTPRPDP
jgi:hypothetical protein